MASKDAAIEENLGYEQIQWMAPENSEEARELLDAVAQAHDQLNQEVEEDENFAADLAALQNFQGIDVSLLGEEDG